VKRLALLLIILAAAGGYFAYSRLTREQPVQVAVQTADIGLVEATVTNTRAGSVKARHRARLAPAIGGRIAMLAVAKGDLVTAGQQLITLWNKDLEAEVALARSEAGAVDASAREACLMADYAERQAERLSELHKSHSTSEASYDEAIAIAAARRAACLAAKAKREVSRARIDAALAMVERTVITAPFAGIIAEINGEIGEYITPSPPGIATLPVIDLINLDSLYVTAPIDEIDAAQIRPGMATRITLDAFPQRAFSGRTRAVSPYVLELAKQARTVEVEVDFVEPLPEVTLLVGYSADVEIIVDAHPGVVRVPTEALLPDGSLYLFLAESGRLAQRKVVVGLGNWRFTEIREGVGAGDQVVTTIDRQGLADQAAAQVDSSHAR
jgi:HlyD family secretion protein